MANPLSKVPILGQVFGDSPQPTPVGLDPATAGMIHEGTQRVTNQTPQDIQNQLESGAEGHIHQLDTSADQEATQTGQDPHLMQAIRNQYQGQIGKDLTRFHNQTQMQSRLRKGQQMSEFAQTAMAQQKMQTQNYEMLANSFQQNEAARAQVVSSILGLAQTGMIMNSMGGRKQSGKNTNAMNEFNSSADASSPYAPNSGEINT